MKGQTGRLVCPFISVSLFFTALGVYWAMALSGSGTGSAPSAVEKYFNEFLAGKLNQALLPNLQKLSAQFYIRLCGSETSVWALTVKEGKLIQISSGTGQSECGFKVETAAFLKIAAGKLSPQMAFFKREIEIEGRMDIGLRLATVLADFFKRFPYEPV